VEEPTPQRDDGLPPMHPLENPFIWSLVGVAEFFIVVLVCRAVFPDHLPLGVAISIYVAILIGIVWANYRIRRRFIPR
jgi:hypothetical protein